jgi:amino acid adenylation domain-containing protein
VTYARFLELAASNSGREAVAFGRAALSYGELAHRAATLARLLRGGGTGAEPVIGVCLPRGPHALVALLGAWMAGGAYLPLDPAYPVERRRFMLEDAGASALITTHELAAELEGSWPVVLDEELSKEDPSPQPAAEVIAPPAENSMAYIMYTSGSTGRPKGVMIEHRSLDAFVSWALGAFGPDELSSVLASTSVGFDISMFELVVPLCAGGRVVMVENLLGLPHLDGQNVTLINTVPSLISALLGATDELPSSVRTVILAGERLTQDVADRVFAAGRVSRLVNAYGPTEDTIYSTWTDVPPGTPPGIGRPLPGTVAHILDSDGQAVRAGAPGELYLGGVGLARGYRGLDVLTAERFIRRPLSGQQGFERLYRTGDIVVRDEDGMLWYRGRADDQFKIRGVRVEPGEVEGVLVRHPAIREAAVALRGDRLSKPQLVAYVVPATDKPPDAQELRGFLRRMLPEPMLPATFIALDEFPLNVNGKLDRALLATVEVPDEIEDERESTSARQPTPTERQLAALWADILELDRFPGIEEDFFDLGGDSLLAAVLFSAIEDDFGVELPATILVEGSRLEQVARRLDAGLDHDPRVIGVHETGSLPPCIYLHGGAGGMLSLRRFRPVLGPEQPFYGLQAYMDVPSQDEPPPVEATAQECLRLVREVQSTGPYLLAGHSVGAHVAFELACLLQAQGEEIALLALLDPPAPETLRVYGRLRARVRELLRLSEDPRSVAEIIRSLPKLRVVRVLSRPRQAAPSAGDAEAERWIRQLVGVERRFHPRTFHGDVTVFYTRKSARYAGGSTLGWDRHVDGQVEIVPVAGDHTSLLLDPHVDDVARKLAGRIQTVQSQLSGPEMATA